MDSPHQVASNPKEIIDRSVDGKKPLYMSQRFEAAHVSFALTGGLVGHFGTIVGVLGRAVLDRGEGGPVGRSIAAEFISDQSIGDVPQPLQQLAKKALSRICIAAFLHENIQDLPILVYGPPQIIACTLIRMKSSSRYQVSPGRPRRRRNFLANVWPNLRHQRRTAS